MHDEEMEQENVGVEMLQSEFVPVVFAADLLCAERLRAILERHDIPALIDDGSSREDVYAVLRRGIPVLVPAQMHDRASDVVAGQENGSRALSAVNGDEDTEEDEEFFDDEEDEEFDDDFDDLDDLDDDYDEEDDEEDEEEDEDVDPDLKGLD